MDKIKEIVELIKSFDPQTKEEAQALVNPLVGLTDLVGEKLADVGVQFKLDVDLGNCGSGRTLIVEENHWSGHEVGYWLPSSETC